MFSSRLLTLVAAAAAGTLLLAGQAAAQCDSTETTALYCYTDADSVPQNVTVADITYVAGYLRSYGAQTQAGRQFTMTAVDAPDCAEWTVYAHGTVLAVAKHIDAAVNSSVLFADIANTIDGGAGASQAALIGCASAGGSFGVVYDATNPQYLTSTYLANDYTPEGILVKIVSSGVVST